MHTDTENITRALYQDGEATREWTPADAEEFAGAVALILVQDGDAETYFLTAEVAPGYYVARLHDTGQVDVPHGPTDLEPAARCAESLAFTLNYAEATP